jgi:hypothetical protein
MYKNHVVLDGVKERCRTNSGRDEGKEGKRHRKYLNHCMLTLEPIPSEKHTVTAREKKLPKSLPQPNPGLFAWIIMGAVGAGKSSMLWSMINNKNGWYKNYFVKIVLWQSTLDSNSTWESIPGAEVINDFHEDFLKAYYDQIQKQQQQLRDKNKRLGRAMFVLNSPVVDMRAAFAQRSPISMRTMSYNKKKIVRTCILCPLRIFTV